MSNSSSRFWEGLLLGGIMGFLGGVLFAPKSGRELRKQIAEGSDEMYKQASSSMSDFKDRTEQALQDIQSKSDSVLKQASVQIQETKDQLTQKFHEIGTNAGARSRVTNSEPESAQHI